jgi:mono/diheme cytochrome c family protein
MSPERMRLLEASRCHAVVLVAAAYFGVAVTGQVVRDVPAGPGADILRARCLTCHQADLIQQQRLGRAAWQRELDKMIRWGAMLPTEEERSLLADYLTANFGAASAVSAPAAEEARGAEIFGRRCMSCHGVDLVEQQRLGPPGWTRELDKMIRWGAAVSDGEKELLIAYLSKLGPR